MPPSGSKGQNWMLARIVCALEAPDGPPGRIGTKPITRLIGSGARTEGPKTEGRRPGVEPDAGVWRAPQRVLVRPPS